MLLSLYTQDHPIHLVALGNLGLAFRDRFTLGGILEDLEKAIGYLSMLMDRCGPDSAYFILSATNLASTLALRYRQTSDAADLTRAIEIYSSALSKCSDDNPTRDSLLNNYANALCSKFELFGDQADLEAALENYRICLNLRPPGHMRRSSLLTNIGDALRLRFTLDQNLSDLEEAITCYNDALQSCAAGQSGYVTLLTSLGVALCSSFEVQGDAEQVEKALACYRSALSASSGVGSEHIRLLDCFGNALQLRHQNTGDIEDLNFSVQLLSTSLELQPTSSTERPVTLLHLGNSLLMRFNITGDLADLNTSVDRLEVALQLCGRTHQFRPFILAAHGDAVLARFKEGGDIGDLDLAIAQSKAALLGFPTRSSYPALLHLNDALLARFGRYRDISDLHAVINQCDDVLNALPPTHSLFARFKGNRAFAFLERFQHEGKSNPADLNLAIDSLRDIESRLPEGEGLFVSVHLHLAIALEVRFNSKGDEADLYTAIQHCRIAHRSCARKNSSYPAVVMQLGINLLLLYTFHGNGGNLDESIVCMADADELLSKRPGNTHYFACLVNLGSAFYKRFASRGDHTDLDTAIEYTTRALEVPTYQDKVPVLINLGTMLCTRHKETHVLADLKQCIQYFESAFATIPPAHPERATLLVCFAQALCRLAKAEDDVRHLELAIQYLRDAISIGRSDPYFPFTVAHLVDVQRRLAMRQHDNDQLQASLDALRALSHLIPKEHPALKTVYLSSASLLLHMFSLNEDPLLLDEAFSCFASAAARPLLGRDLPVSLKWAKQAERLHHSSELQAYRVSLSSLDTFTHSTLAVSSRHKYLSQSKNAKYINLLPSKAMACAIERRSLEVAVELSEQGRGLIWHQLAHTRTPLDALRQAGEDGMALASDFERVSAQLERWSSRSISEMTAQASRLTAEEDTRLYKQRHREWVEIINRVREKKGFESFLRAFAYNELQEAAVGGPAILLNAHEKHCDAIVVTKDRPPLLIPLQSTSVTELVTMGETIYRVLKETGYVGEGKVRERRLVPVLRKLWDVVVEPIVNELLKFLPRGSRVWFCPTSKFTTLPLHAAGPYRRGLPNLPDIYICSYTPSLSALNRSRSQKSHLVSAPPSSFLAIGQSNSAINGSQESELQSVSAELALVESLIPSSSLSFKRISGDEGTADTAIEGLRTHAWVHLACHGKQDLGDPFASAFSLKDRPISLLDIIRAEPENPAFAFLSACDTAVGDEHTPDEVIHLAAGMQFAGFRSVIGTMWAVDDSTAQHMVREFYKHMFSGDKAPDSTQAAKALNKASKTVDKNVVPLDQRIVFIHIGV
ncbi:CHAT domain-containing protein [Pisolithus orientalis]|uniref:CHAT domain-containing protein n=1 Tax=Pisolithus orientalis TaxID=936130 RepID=UPI002225A5BB|nr:CHAT domain-containing protein [Pisolithus orientalis]KAI6025753.1 CHAT domain-containing protein [Pisolithus orientalis]